MHNLLVIDDDADIRDTLTSLLESDEDYKVNSCSTADEADKLLKQNHYSTILVDIFLPDRNGIDFVSDIRQQNINTPIIIITGSSEIDLARKAIRLGVFDYLVKPFKYKQLQQTIRNAVIQNNLQEEREYLENQKAMYQQELEKMVRSKVSELRVSEQKYQNLVEQSLVGVYIIQEDLFRYLNRKMCQIFECEGDKIVDQKGLLDFTHEDHYQLVKSNLSRPLISDEDSGSFRFKALTSTGKEKILEVWAGSIQYQGKPAIEGIVLDITDEHNYKLRERQLELELMNEHKLAAIGRLAAGISHNLNTPISIIQGNAELLRLKSPDNPELGKILNQTARMTELINTILGKARSEQDTEAVDIDINELLANELEFLNANMFFKHKIDKVFTFANDLPKFRGVYSDFSQSILNIVQNAIDAMFDSDIRRLEIETSLDDDDILIQISDSGCGISEKNKSKIFDPFFTTKPMQIDGNSQTGKPRGTGLGLSLCYRLLSLYGAKIEFDSEEGKGTTFRIKLPVRT